jgi:hypothetical protein
MGKHEKTVVPRNSGQDTRNFFEMNAEIMVIRNQPGYA